MFDLSQVVIGISSFIWGFAFGVLFICLWEAKKQKQKEETEKQTKMWNDYLEALKGGQNAK